MPKLVGKIVKCVGYELAITNLISNKRESNNCFITGQFQTQKHKLS